MKNYAIGIQKTTGDQFKVVQWSTDNGKLVMQSEPMHNRKDAEELLWGLVVFPHVVMKTELIPASKKWPKNSGPKNSGPQKFGKSTPVLKVRKSGKGGGK